MTKENGELLVDLVAQEVLRVLEAVIFEKQFTQYGGLQVGKEVQYFADFCARRTHVPIHGRFARINQVAQVLMLSSVCATNHHHSTEAQHRITALSLHTAWGRGRVHEQRARWLAPHRRGHTRAAQAEKGLCAQRCCRAPAPHHISATTQQHAMNNSNTTQHTRKQQRYL